jgi:hypothetical protein
MLYALDDGDWHSLTEVAEELDWSMSEAIEVARYFARGRFIHFDEDTGKVKLQPWVKKYPRGKWVKPGKRSIGAVSIPADGSVMLQETLVHNGFDVEVEVNFMVVDEKLAEIFILKGK